MSDPDDTTNDPGDDSSDETADTVAAALGTAARRAGLDPNASSSTSGAVAQAIGGWRGVIESVVPSLAFITVYTFTRNLPWSLGISVGLAAIMVLARVLAKSTPAPAIGGLFATGAAAALALWTGRPENNFILGMISSGIVGLILLISVLVRWPLVGLAIGFLMDDGTTWRADRAKRRAFAGLTLAWVAIIAVRLVVQIPLYLAGPSAVTALGVAKLALGLPLFAPLVAIGWFVVRSLYPHKRT